MSLWWCCCVILNIGVAHIHLDLLTQFWLHWPAAVEHTSVRHMKKIWGERPRKSRTHPTQSPSFHESLKHPEAESTEVTLWCRETPRGPPGGRVLLSPWWQRCLRAGAGNWTAQSSERGWNARKEAAKIRLRWNSWTTSKKQTHWECESFK